MLDNTNVPFSAFYLISPKFQINISLLMWMLVVAKNKKKFGHVIHVRSSN